MLYFDLPQDFHLQFGKNMKKVNFSSFFRSINCEPQIFTVKKSETNKHAVISEEKD